MRDRFRCLIGRHDFPEWGAWVHGGRRAYYRQRWCRRPRCRRGQTETDG